MPLCCLLLKTSFKLLFVNGTQMCSFMLEETGVLKQRKFHTQVAKDICYAQLCVFSYVAAGTDQNCNIKEVT
ncbi:hypothetical protein EB796_015031 [Bugula neritina]|uniref:Secreted protein n=1 Tax=Bugula neritina TaxID=10212 RepID=A0A7J7JJY6_BUGNE|nr:hypothetical protein EB796_015031 [Bugula neritina]